MIGYIVGAGAQGRVFVETWRAREPGISLELLDDNPELVGGNRLGAPIVGPVSQLAKVDWSAGGRALIAIGDNPERLALAAAWSGVAWATLAHPSAIVMSSARIGDGTVIFAGAVVNTDARLGSQVLVNTRAIVEHDCVLEDGSSIGPGVTMGGRVVIGRGAFLSAGVTVAPRTRIGPGTVVGAGAVVVKDLPANVLAYGVPARVVRSLDDGFDWTRLL